MDRNYEDLVQAMSKKKTKTKTLTPEQQEEIRTKDFFDCILPGTVKFYTDLRVADRYAFVHFHAQESLAGAQLCRRLLGFRQSFIPNVSG